MTEQPHTTEMTAVSIAHLVNVATGKKRQLSAVLPQSLCYRGDLSPLLQPPQSLRAAPLSWRLGCATGIPGPSLALPLSSHGTAGKLLALPEPQFSHL